MKPLAIKFLKRTLGVVVGYTAIFLLIFGTSILVGANFSIVHTAILTLCMIIGMIIFIGLAMLLSNFICWCFE